jgi:uncharacterized protein YecE (DUF72 family)
MGQAELHTMVGTAGWAIPAQQASLFFGDGSHLQRYATRFKAVEINSSFYRPHRPQTYERWAATVPSDFRFAVKVPKEITHVRRLKGTEDLLGRFLGEASALGDNLGPLLVQLPPSFVFEKVTVAGFLHDLRNRFSGAVVCEPRHRTWFDDDVDRFLADLRIARVAADPAIVPRAAEPGGWTELCYHRLHGSPRIYYSAYSSGDLDSLESRLAKCAGECWCIFDNTAEGAATQNALALIAQLSSA